MILDLEDLEDLEDDSQVGQLINQLFEVLNTPNSERMKVNKKLIKITFLTQKLQSGKSKVSNKK